MKARPVKSKSIVLRSSETIRGELWEVEQCQDVEGNYLIAEIGTSQIILPDENLNWLTEHIGRNISVFRGYKDEYFLKEE